MNSDTKPTSLVPAYVLVIVCTVVGILLGTSSLICGVMMFVGSGATLPGILGLITTGNAVIDGLTATVCGLIVMMTMKKIATSPEAGALVASPAYAAANKAGKIIAYSLAVLGIIGAVGILLYALLSINDYTPWKSYFLGQILPALVTAAGVAGAGMLIDKFSKAQVKPNQLAMVVLGVAAAGLLIGAIAVGVKSHSSSDVESAGGNVTTNTTIPTTTLPSASSPSSDYTKSDKYKKQEEEINQRLKELDEEGEDLKNSYYK